MYPIDYRTVKFEHEERIQRAQRENLALTARRRHRPRAVRRHRWQLWRRPAPIRIPRLRLASDS